MTEKYCSKCEESKLLVSFPLKKSGYYTYCIECNRADARNYYTANRKKVADKIKVLRAAGKLNTSYIKEWERRCPERLKEIKRKSRIKNPETSRAITENRRARKLHAGGSHSARDIKNIFLLQRGRCAICVASLSVGYHADHIISLAAGGTNDRYNIQLLCPRCNMLKGSKDPIEYAQRIGKLL